MKNDLNCFSLSFFCKKNFNESSCNGLYIDDQYLLISIRYIIRKIKKSISACFNEFNQTVDSKPLWAILILGVRKSKSLRRIRKTICKTTNSCFKKMCLKFVFFSGWYLNSYGLLGLTSRLEHCRISFFSFLFKEMWI